MAHVYIVRQAITFVEHPDAVVGTHEEVERNIDSRMYRYDGMRNGHHTPTSSQWMLLDYRIKEECIPQFLADLQATNFKPRRVGWKFWLSFVLPQKWLGYHDGTHAHWMYGGMQKYIMALLRFIPWLHGIDFNPSVGIPLTDKWSYNFFVGYVKDRDDLL
jgi:hypothetical protein